MNKEELERFYIKRDGLTFTPRTTYAEKVLEDGSKDYKYTIIASAEEAYQEYLSQKEQATKNQEIKSLKVQLMETDYKIIKCSEYQLAGQPLPYDIQELHTERQALRDRINDLEATLI